MYDPESVHHHLPYYNDNSINVSYTHLQYGIYHHVRLSPAPARTPDFLRQVKGRPQTTQSFTGKLCGFRNAAPCVILLLRAAIHLYMLHIIYLH